jgi:hypothetical protein
MNPRQPCVLEPKSGPGDRPTLSQLSAIKVFPCLFAPFAWSRPSRPKCQPEVFTQFSRFTFHVSRQRHPQIALFPRRFCAVFKGGIYYSLTPNHLRSPTLKTVQFPIDIACPADLPRPITPCAPRSNVFTFPVTHHASRSRQCAKVALPQSSPRFSTIPGRLASCQLPANLCQPVPT